MSQLVTINREKETFSNQPEPNLNVGPSSIRPLVQNTMKRVDVITSLRPGRLIDHNLEDLVDVPVELSLSLSPPSLSDSALKDATDSTPIDPSPSQPTD